MDAARQGEIALRVLKYIVEKSGVHVSKDKIRELGDIAKKIDVPLDELKAFAKPILQEAFDKCFDNPPAKK